MGRGNVCVFGEYEGLYYIDNDHIHVYRDSEDMSDYPETRLMGALDYGELIGGRWLFEKASGDEWIRAGLYGDRSRRVILESKLFYVCLEDNEWSLAVELIQKEEPWGLSWMENLQKRLYEKYLDGMKKALLNRLPSIGIRTGAWTSGTIKRDEVMA